MLIPQNVGLYSMKNLQSGEFSNNLQSEECLGFLNDQIEVPQIVVFACNKTPTMWGILSKNLQSEEVLAFI